MNPIRNILRQLKKTSTPHLLPNSITWKTECLSMIVGKMKVLYKKDETKKKETGFLNIILFVNIYDINIYILGSRCNRNMYA